MEQTFLKHFRKVHCKVSAMETFFINLQKGLEIYLEKTPTQVLSRKLCNIFLEKLFCSTSVNTVFLHKSKERLEKVNWLTDTFGQTDSPYLNRFCGRTQSPSIFWYWIITLSLTYRFGWTTWLIEGLPRTPFTPSSML